MIPRTHEEIEAKVREIQLKKKLSDHDISNRVGFGEIGILDRELYVSKNKFEGYATSIAVGNEIDDDLYIPSKLPSYTAPPAILKEIAESEVDINLFSERRQKPVSEREDEYRQRHRRIVLSPDRTDPFSGSGKTPAPFGSRTFKDIMKEQELSKIEKDLRARLIEKAKERALKAQSDKGSKHKICKLTSRDFSMNKKHKRSRSSSSSPHFTDSDDENSKQKSFKSRKHLEDKYHRRKQKHQRSRSRSSSSERDYKDKTDKNHMKSKDTNLISGVKVKEEPVSDEERDRKYQSRITEDRRSNSRQQSVDTRRRPEHSHSSDPHQRNRRPIKEEVLSDKEPEWGKKNIKSEKKEPAKNNAKPDFGLSGKLTEDANTYNGVVIKYSEPPEARKPKRRWRLYPFKGETSLPVLHIHRQSAYLMGRDRKVADIPIDHPSCSKQHAALQYRLVPFTRSDGSKGRQIKLYIIDLESANGTYLNNQKIEPKKYYELKERDVIKFGYSSREYVLLHEHSKDSGNDDDVNIDD